MTLVPLTKVRCLILLCFLFLFAVAKDLDVEEKKKEEDSEFVEVEKIWKNNEVSYDGARLYNTSLIHIFYILTPNKGDVKQIAKREENVLKAMTYDSTIKYFSGLYYKDWNVVKLMYNAFKIPTVPMPKFRGFRNRRGKYARWASLIMAASYAIQFRLPNIVILEDDSVWPKDLGKQIVKYVRSEEEANTVVKLSTWGEGFLMTLPCAINYIKTVYDIGINSSSDVWIRDMLPSHNINKAIKYKLIVMPNKGNIWNTDIVMNHVDFDYVASTHNPAPLTNRLGVCFHPDGTYEFKDVDSKYALFKSRADLNFTEVAERVDLEYQKDLC